MQRSGPAEDARAPAGLGGSLCIWIVCHGTLEPKKVRKITMGKSSFCRDAYLSRAKKESYSYSPTWVSEANRGEDIHIIVQYGMSVHKPVGRAGDNKCRVSKRSQSKVASMQKGSSGHGVRGLAG